jgi:antitoxin component YwqK of YwqJK toxin-antitoxin module
MLTLEIRKPRRIRWFTINRNYHNLLNPAHISWYQNGQKYYETYYVNDKFHRDPNLGPAYTLWHSNGQKYWESYYLHDEYHRDPTLGPTNIFWYSDGQKSRESYYVNGEQVDKPC